MAKKTVGPISAKEKENILKMAADNKPLEKIMAEVGRSKSAVEKVIQDYTRLIHKIESNETVAEQDTQPYPLEKIKHKGIFDAVKNRLIETGLSQKGSVQRLNMVLSRFKHENINEISQEQLYQEALRMTPAGELMVSKSENSTRSVTVLTEASEQLAEKSPKQSRRLKDCLFPI